MALSTTASSSHELYYIYIFIVFFAVLFCINEIINYDYQEQINSIKTSEGIDIILEDILTVGGDRKLLIKQLVLI